MADSDKILGLLVNIGVVGQADIKAANDLLAETASKAEESGKKAANAAEKKKQLAKVMDELNKISPGVGDGVNLLAQAYMKAGAAAEGGKVSMAGFATALSGLTRSVGPTMIASLGIEAVTTWWDFFKEKAEAAAKAQAESMDKIRESTKEALDEHANFDEAMKKASEPEDKFAESLAHAETIILAQTEAKRKLLKLDEEAELAKAKTPEEKEAITKRYDQKDAALSSGEESEKIDALAKTGEAARVDRDKAETEKTDLTEKIKAIIADARNALQLGDSDYHDELLAKLPALNEKIPELDERIISDRTRQTRYEAEADTQGEIHAINDDERLRASDRTVSKGVEGIDAHAHGEKLSQEQIKANQALTELFAAHTGGIQQMQQIIKHHLEQSTTQAQEIAALKNALDGLQNQAANSRNSRQG